MDASTTTAAVDTSRSESPRALPAQARACARPLALHLARGPGCGLLHRHCRTGLRVGIVVDVNKDITAFQTDKSADGSTIIHRLSISSVGALGKL